MSFLSRIFGAKAAEPDLRPLYDAVVAAARDPLWYRSGGVPDTMDGRFDMVAAVLALVLLRLEQGSERARQASVALTEAFIADMDGTVRQIGIGDVVVGKHVGRMVGALGGRLSAFRAAGQGSLEAPIARNIFHDAPPSRETLLFTAGRLEDLRDALLMTPEENLLAGEMPKP